MQLTISRESEQIFTVKSDSGYWSDGAPIDERLALADSPWGGQLLSNSRAQAIDRTNGNGYILIGFFSISNPELVAKARAMAIGSSFIHVTR